MRCSLCEPVLDAYLEGTLRRRQAWRVAEHLRGCRSCEALFGELRVIDALLTTARPPGKVGADFTAGVLAATRKAPAGVRRRISLLVPLGLYLAAAWALAAFAALRSNQLLSLVEAGLERGARDAAAVGAAVRAIAPDTPVAAAAVTGVLLIDLLLLAALLYGYRRVRPYLAFHLSRGPRS